MLSVPHCGRLSIFLFIIWTIKNLPIYFSIQIRSYHVYITNKSDVPALTFWPNIPEMGVNIFLDVHAQYYSIDHVFPGWKSGHTFKYGCNSPHNLVMTTFKCSQLLFFLHGCCVCSPFGMLHLLFAMFWEGQQTSLGSWGQWYSVRRTSCKVWHVKTVWNRQEESAVKKMMEIDNSEWAKTSSVSFGKEAGKCEKVTLKASWRNRWRN